MANQWQTIFAKKYMVFKFYLLARSPVFQDGNCNIIQANRPSFSALANNCYGSGISIIVPPFQITKLARPQASICDKSNPANTDIIAMF